MQIHGCPTCIGKIDKNVPAFFEDEYEYYAEQYEFDIKNAQAQTPRNDHDENA